ncbi:OmpA family protein [Crocinitomicaceae bacterium]|nr:OmpA family protein [Crocinitomicaceae bacterium]MDC0099590.1 OmpA family protein [Crocinitomicaceae bacterium]MDC1384523.1 OmpA family protein [Crocinitomicaceae bacterium]
MKLLISLIIIAFSFTSCFVPAKKYQELVEKEKLCSEELEAYKTKAMNFQGSSKDYQSKYEVASKQLEHLIADSTALSRNHKILRAKYDKEVEINQALEASYGKLRITGAADVAKLNADLEVRRIQLQKKEDALTTLERDLLLQKKQITKQQDELTALNSKIEQQEAASKVLKDKLNAALKNFKNEGLTVEERNGKIYVSLEAKLLFASGSTAVEAEGKKALIELAKVLQEEKELEIIVEGHTDTDKMAGTKHPVNNWELSVLRATSVISIMTSNSELDPRQLMAGGRSEFQPVDPNDKTKNRRIEIIISPNLDDLYQLISE